MFLVIDEKYETLSIHTCKQLIQLHYLKKFKVSNMYNLVDI